MILSLNYQPRRIEEVFGDGAGTGVRMRYVVEPAPLGTGGAIRYAAQGITDTLVVFNGDVMTSVDVKAVVAQHRERKAKATIVLTPVDNPSRLRAGRDRVRRPRAPLPREAESRRDHLRHDQRRHLRARARHLRSHPKDVSYSIERAYFPSLIERGETVRRLRRSRLLDRHRHAGESTSRSIATCSRAASGGPLRGVDRAKPIVSPEARIEDGARSAGPASSMPART